jgi:hypothetical protein
LIPGSKFKLKKKDIISKKNVVAPKAPPKDVGSDLKA